MTFILYFIVGIFPWANAQSTCGSDTASGYDYKWCIHQNPQSHDLLHYMHVSGGSENRWINQNTNVSIRKHWAEAKKEVPNVITISFGMQWLLTDVPNKDQPGKHQVFIEQILPYLESKIETKISRRILLGDSMGGLNSSQLMLKNGNLFERAAINCPAITTIGPYATKEEISAYIERNQPYINRFRVVGMLMWGRQEFPDDNSWQKHDPIRLAQSSMNLPSKIYVSCGDQDEFGFIEGAKAMAGVFVQRGLDVTWRPVSGGHCKIDTKAVAKFLIP